MSTEITEKKTVAANGYGADSIQVLEGLEVGERVVSADSAPAAGAQPGA